MISGIFPRNLPCRPDRYRIIHTFLERGVVWEETIILLPDNVRFVFLSATIPNARQFAEWVAHLHRQPCHVVYTDYRSTLLTYSYSLFYCLVFSHKIAFLSLYSHVFRPVPLQHYIYPCAGEGIHLIVDDRSNFLQENFQKAMSSLSEEGDSRAGGRRARNSKPIHGRVNTLLICAVFSFIVLFVLGTPISTRTVNYRYCTTYYCTRYEVHSLFCIFACREAEPRATCLSS